MNVRYENQDHRQRFKNVNCDISNKYKAKKKIELLKYYIFRTEYHPYDIIPWYHTGDLKVNPNSRSEK